MLKSNLILFIAVATTAIAIVDSTVQRGVLQTTLTINGNEYEAIPASFPTWIITRLSNKPIVISDTASRLGCDYITNFLFQETISSNNNLTLDDSIVILDKGLCDFAQKIRGAEMLGAAAVIVVNNQDTVFSMGEGINSAEVSIPSVMISKSAGDDLRENVLISTSTSSNVGSLTILPIPCDGEIISCDEGQYCEYVSELKDDLLSEIMQQQEYSTTDNLREVGYCIDGCDSSSSCPDEHFCYVKSDNLGCTSCDGKGPIFCSLLDIRGDVPSADSCWDTCSTTWQVCSELEPCPSGYFCTFNLGSNGYCEECDRLRSGAQDCQGFVSSGKFSCLDTCFDSCSTEEQCAGGEFCIVSDGNTGHCSSILTCDANEICPEDYYCSSRYQRCTNCDKLSAARCLTSDDELDNGCIESCSEGWEACSGDNPCSSEDSFCASSFCIECVGLKDPHECDFFDGAAKDNCITTCFQICSIDNVACDVDEFCGFQLGISGACVDCKMRVGASYLSAFDCTDYNPSGEARCINSCFQTCSADSECPERSFCSHQLDNGVGACVDCSSIDHPSDCSLYSDLGKDYCLSTCFDTCSDTSPCSSDSYCYYVDGDAGVCMSCHPIESGDKGIVAVMCMELSNLRSQQSCVDSCYVSCSSTTDCPGTMFCDNQISNTSGACTSCSAWLTDLGPISSSSTDCSTFFDNGGATNCIDECFDFCGPESSCNTDKFCNYQLDSSGGACIDCSTVQLASECFEYSEGGRLSCVSNCFDGCSPSESCGEESFCLLGEDEIGSVCINCAGIEDISDCAVFSEKEIQASCMQTCFSPCSEDNPCTDGSSICQSYSEFGRFCRECARSRLQNSCTYGDVLVQGRTVWSNASPLSPIRSVEGRLVVCTFGDEGSSCNTQSSERFICYMNESVTSDAVSYCIEAGGIGAIFVPSKDQGASNTLAFSPYPIPVVTVPGIQSATLLENELGSLVRINVFTSGQNRCSDSKPCSNDEFCGYELVESGFCRGCDDIKSCFFSGLNPRGSADCALACQESLEFPNCKLCPQRISASSFGTANEDDTVCSFCPYNDIQYLDRSVPMFGPNATCSSMDFLIDSLQIDADDINCRLSQKLNFACGCAGSGYAGASNTSKQAVLTWLPRTTAILSFLGSTFIIVDILRDRKRRRKLFGNMMVMMSLFDALGSAAYAFTTLPIPANSYIYGSKGNNASCTVQAFFIQMGLIAAYFNVSIGFYYLVMIKYGWHERRCVTYKKYFIACPLIVGFIFAFSGVPFYGNMVTWCNNTAKWWPESAVVVAIIAATIMMLLVVIHVYNEEKASKKWKKGKQKNSLTKEVMWQAIYYLYAFYLVWPPYLALQFLWARGSAFDNYGLVLAASTMVTMQGVWNFVAYVKRQYKTRLSNSGGRITVKLEKLTSSLSKRLSRGSSSASRVSTKWQSIRQSMSRASSETATEVSKAFSSEEGGKGFSLSHVESPLFEEEKKVKDSNRLELSSELKTAPTKVTFAEQTDEDEEKKMEECNADKETQELECLETISEAKGGEEDNTEDLAELLHF